MGQSVESTVNIKVTADTSQAQAEMKRFTSSDIADSLNSLANGYSAIDEALRNSTSDIANNIDKIGDESLESAINVNDLIKTLSSITSSGNLSTGAFEKLGKAIGMSGGELALVGAEAAIAIGAFKLLSDNLKEVINGFTKLGSSLGSSAIDGIEWFINALKDMSDTIDDTIEKLQEFADLGIDIQNAYIGLGNFIGTDALAGLNQYADTLESLYGLDATGVISDMNRLSAALASLGGTSEQLEGAGKNLYNLALDLHGLNPALTSTEKAISDINRAIEYGNITKRMESLYAMLGKEGVDAFNKLNTAQERYNFLMKSSMSIHGAYQAYLDTDAGKIEILKQQYSSLLGNIGQIALHLYAMVAPVLTKILQLANGVLGALMKLFNIDVKSSTGIGGAGGLGSIKNDLDEVSKSAGKATKQLASFDDVIQINDNKSGGIGEVGDLGGLEDFGGLLGDLIDDSNELTDVWERFKRLIEEGDWLNAGKEFIKVLAEQLDKIPWDEIKEKAAGAGKGIAEFLNGIFDTDLDGFLAWTTIGKTIAESFNTIISFVDSLLTEFSFVKAGKSLGTAWAAMWDNIDVEGAAHALYEAFTGVFEFVIGWLEGGGLSKVATAFSEFISSFFGNFTDFDIDNIAYAVEGVIDDIINALSIAADAITSDDAKRVVFGIITKLVEAFKNNAAGWGSKLNDVAMDILNFIKEGISTADNAGIHEAFREFIFNLNLSEILTAYLQIKWALWKEKFRIWVITLFSAIGGFIWDAIMKVIQLVSAVDILIISLLAKFGTTIWNGLNNIGEDIYYIFTDIWDFIKGIFDPENWANIAKDAINALWNGIKSVWNNTIGSWSIDIPGVDAIGWEGIHIAVPKLATGGIATRSTLANIGEAGAEAILPLENNTGWMDKLATKIANQVGGSSAGGTVRVELSDKPFYTRAEMYEFGALIVDSLKAYGLNIAIV